MLGASLKELFTLPAHTIGGSTNKRSRTVITFAFRCLAKAVEEFVPEGRLRDRVTEHLQEAWLLSIHTIDMQQERHEIVGDETFRTIGDLAAAVKHTEESEA